METIEQEKQRLHKNWKKGTTCKCCSQYVKLYRRSVSASMAYGLVVFNNYIKKHNPKDGWVQAEEMLLQSEHKAATRGHNFALLRRFGLVEALEEKREDGSPSNGFYRITQKGIDFAENRITIKRYVYLYNNKEYKLEDQEEVPRVGIREALKNKFNYDELMKEY